MRQLYGDSSTHTPSPKQFGILSVVCNLYTSRPAPFTLLFSQYLHQSEKVVPLTKTIVKKTSHSFKNSVTMIANSVYTEKVNFLLSTVGNVNLNFTVRSKSLKKFQDHILERTRFFWRGLKHWVSLSSCHLVYKLLGIG